jgi:AraC family transcriptional regulator of arabinose operon
MKHYEKAYPMRTDLGYEKCLPLHRYGPAIREYHLLHFVISGKGRFFTEDGTFTIKQGEGFYITPGELTTYVADDLDPWEYLWIGVGDRGESREVLLRHGLEKGVHKFTYEDSREVLSSYAALLKEKLPFSYERTMAAFYSLIDTLPLSHDASSFVDQCYGYFERHYFEEIKVEEMARDFNLSRSQLYRLCKPNLKASPQELILQYRLEKADELVQRPGVSLTQIAFSCGFCDLSHFSKAYKKRYGKRPRAKRKK